MKEIIMENGIMGAFNGYRIHGKSYDNKGNQINEVHKKDCFCCRANLLKKKS